MKKRVRATIGSTLSLVGLNRPVEKVPPVTPLPNPLEAVYALTEIVFSVPVEKCVTSYHFAYPEGGWHPFVRTLRQYMADPSTTFDTSILNRYYQIYQPANAWEVFFENEDVASGVRHSRLKECRTDAYFPPNPWDYNLIPLRGEGGLHHSHGVQGYGPVSREKGEFEFSRLLKVYRSIQERGYRPTPDSDGEIRGYFLRIGSDYRFFIRAGLHRMAALVAMGYKDVRVKFLVRYPRSIDLADIDHWPLVRGGTMERNVAAHIFRRHFTDNGSKKARNLGLL